VGDSGGGEALGVAAVAHELALQGADLLVKQVVGLVNKADEGVGYYGGVGVVEPGRVEFTVG
jgi:hypothetical protein